MQGNRPDRVSLYRSTLMLQRAFSSLQTLYHAVCFCHCHPGVEPSVGVVAAFSANHLVSAVVVIAVVVFVVMTCFP